MIFDVFARTALFQMFGFYLVLLANISSKKLAVPKFRTSRASFEAHNKLR